MNVNSPDLNHFRLALRSFVGAGRPHNQTTLAHASGVSRTMINGLIKGQRGIGRQSQEKIARACGFSLADFLALGQLVEDGKSPEPIIRSLSGRHLPVISLAANDPECWSQPVALDIAASILPASLGLIVVMVSGDLMRPEGIKNGMLCYCDLNQEPFPGDVVYVTRRDGLAMVKSYAGQGPEGGIENGFLRLRGWRELEAQLQEFYLDVPLTEIQDLAPVILVRRRL